MIKKIMKNGVLIMLEQLKNDFLGRYKEVKAAYDRLELRQNEIKERYRELKKQMSKDTDVDAEKLLSGLKGDSKLESEIASLNNEWKAINETLEAVRSKGGLSYICKTDGELKKLAVPLYENLMKEAEKDEKQRIALEKRYEKVIAEVIQLEEERRAFNEKAEKHSRILRLISENTGFEIKYNQFIKHYKYEKAGILAHLGKVKERIEKKLY